MEFCYCLFGQRSCSSLRRGTGCLFDPTPRPRVHRTTIIHTLTWGDDLRIFGSDLRDNVSYMGGVQRQRGRVSPIKWQFVACEFVEGLLGDLLASVLSQGQLSLFHAGTWRSFADKCHL